MRPADEDSQAIASPEASDRTPSEEEEGSSALPELAVIGAAAEASDEKSTSAEDKPSARERLTSRTREGRPRKKRGPLIAAIILLILTIGAIGSAAGGLAYLRWYANDDALDFQGTWYVAGTETPIEITADAIQLTESVAYRYKLNTQDKTITLTIGNMTGNGSYRFSLDRDQLVIFDGRTDPNAFLEADVRWLVQALYDDIKDQPNDVTAGIRRNRTLLTREPNTFPVSIADSATSSENPESSSSGSQEPQTVWSAEDWLNSNDASTDDDSTGSSSSGASTISNANDVASLLEGINDLPNGTVDAPEEPAS